MASILQNRSEHAWSVSMASASPPQETAAMTSNGATLVVPDIHNNFTAAEERIAEVRERFPGRISQIVFLGDYFDDYGDTPEMTRQTAEWLQHSVEQSDRVHLVGNHDLAYLAPSPFTWCSGFEDAKFAIASPILDAMPRERFRAALEVDGWLLSHAGFHQRHAAGRAPAELIALADSALRQLWEGAQPELFAAGYARGGSAPSGGITWCDWIKEFQPTSGIHQIVGHTPARTIRLFALEYETGRRFRRSYEVNVAYNETFPRGKFPSFNVCLDTGMRAVALIENGAIVIL